MSFKAKALVEKQSGSWMDFHALTSSWTSTWSTALFPSLMKKIKKYSTVLSAPFCVQLLTETPKNRRKKFQFWVKVFEKPFLILTRGCDTPRNFLVL
jgi:hypothetical protein